MSLFSKPAPLTIEGIVADIQEKVDALHNIGLAKNEEASDLSYQIVELQRKYAAVNADEGRAHALANNFAKLLEVE